MHESVRRWVEHRTSGLRFRRVIEVGGLDVNGGVRDIVAAERWRSFDIVDGPGVDTVADAHDLPVEDASADLVLCLEMLEHDSDPNATFAEMARVAEPGSRILVTTRSEGFPLHHEPDYWRFTFDDIEALAFTAGLSVAAMAHDPQPGHPGVFAELLA